jgi:hypothetical protein
MAVSPKTSILEVRVSNLKRVTQYSENLRVYLFIHRQYRLLQNPYKLSAEDCFPSYLTIPTSYMLQLKLSLRNLTVIHSFRKIILNTYFLYLDQRFWTYADDWCSSDVLWMVHISFSWMRVSWIASYSLTFNCQPTIIFCSSTQQLPKNKSRLFQIKINF